MKLHRSWSYHPYKPLFFEGGDIYVCRIVPARDSISLWWLDIGEKDYSIFYRVKGEEAYILAGMTDKCEYKISGLTQLTDYEFYVAAGDRKSRVRIARCDDAVGTVVNYLHPEDDAYSFSGKFLCSPSMVRHPDGYLLASTDLFSANYPQNLTLIFRSDDEGKSWQYVSELFPCFWGKMFIHKNELYMLSCSTEYGELLIGKSSDGGKTFTEPSVLLRGSNGKNGETGIHKNPQPVVEFGGRLWNTLEWGSWARGYHAPMVMSADLESDLLNPDSWSFSYPVKYNPEWPGVAKGESTGNIEGCLVELDGGLYNIMRYDTSKTVPNFGLIIKYKVDTEKPENPLRFDGVIEFPANLSKFIIKYCEATGKYYSIATRITGSDAILRENQVSHRNVLSLMESDDCISWRLNRDIYNRSDADPWTVGFQYVDFIIEGKKIIFLCRTALNNPRNFHDSNYITFDCLELE